MKHNQHYLTFILHRIRCRRSNTMIILFVFSAIFIAVLGVVGTVRMLIDTSLTPDERVGHFFLCLAFFTVVYLLVVGGRAYVQDELNSGAIVEVGND